MSYLVTVNTNVSQLSGGGGADALPPMVFNNPAAPTRAEVERLAQERWHTRPDWWANGAPPKVIGFDPLPSEFAFDSQENRITAIATGGELDGWDFAQTQTHIFVDSGDDIAAITNCKFAPVPVTKAQRISDPNIEQPLQFAGNSNGRIRLLSRCWFTMHEDHDGGSFGANSLIYSWGDSTVFPTVDVMEFCSIEGYAGDGLKAVFGGLRRYCFIDTPWNIPDDATQWQSGTTYNRNDVVYDANNRYFLRLCKSDGVTTSPNWGSKNASTTLWEALDPHSDLDQAPCTGDVEYLGCFFNRDQRLRRFPSRQGQRGVTDTLRYNSFTNSSFGDITVHYNVFTEHVELAFGGRGNISFGGPFRTGKTGLVENNWHANNIMQDNGGGGTVGNNTGGWTPWNPASLSAITASYAGNELSYGFSASVGGWATVVLSTSPTPMTAEEIIYASVGSGGVLAKYEIDAPANTARSAPHSVALGAGTYYAHMLYQAGGGVDTVAPVQTVVV